MFRHLYMSLDNYVSSFSGTLPSHSLVAVPSMVQKTAAGWNRKFSTTNPHLVPLPHAHYCLAYQRFGMRGPRQKVFETSKWLDCTIGVAGRHMAAPDRLDSAQSYGREQNYSIVGMVLLACNRYEPLTGGYSGVISTISSA